jgi:hypothetical protein
MESRIEERRTPRARDSREGRVPRPPAGTDAERAFVRSRSRAPGYPLVCVRSPVAPFALVAALVFGLLPCDRCAPVEAGGAGTTVVVGAHAHEAPPCCGDCCGDDVPAGPCEREPGEGHGPSCCEHAASDAGAPAARVVLETALPRRADAVAAATTAVRAERATPGADAPVPRRPTETVVLLR